MKPILIGSRALAFWNDSFTVKNTADWDVVSDEPIDGFEWHNPTLLNNSDIQNYVSSDITTEFNGIELDVVSLRGVALIKRSHLWRDLHFDRHITMYHRYLSMHMDNLTDADVNFLNARTSLTHKEFPRQHPKLNTSKEDFFEDFVIKKYDHDDIHKIVAFSEIPMYNMILKDNEPVFCDVSKWNTLSHTEKLRCIVEEAYVISIERFLVPKDWKYPSKLAYMKSLNKVCTTLCSGWFRDYAIDYYPEAFDMFDEAKFLKFKERIENELS